MNGLQLANTLTSIPKYEVCSSLTNPSDTMPSMVCGDWSSCTVTGTSNPLGTLADRVEVKDVLIRDALSTCPWPGDNLSSIDLRRDSMVCRYPCETVTLLEPG